jgi:hypothetical protein
VIASSDVLTAMITPTWYKNMNMIDQQNAGLRRRQDDRASFTENGEVPYYQARGYYTNGMLLQVPRHCGA